MMKDTFDKKHWKKRGFIFTIDAMLAAMLLVMGVVLISHSLVDTQSQGQTEYVSQDLLGALSTISVKEVDDPWVRNLVDSGEIADPDTSLLVQIGTFWATDEIEEARNLTQIVMSDIVPPGMGVELMMGSDILYEQNATRSTKQSAVARRMISGVAKGEVLAGSTGSAFLKRIKDKRTAAYAEFGGFVGQGNISIYLKDLPDDANITDATIELDAGGVFDLYINDDFCDSFTPTAGLFTADAWDISHCNESFVPGIPNLISANFTGDLNRSFVAGGYVRVRYKTDMLSDVQDEGNTLFQLPGIRGIANYYDGFISQGTIRNISVYLHYNTSYPSYFSIGGSQVYSSEDLGEQQVALTDVNLTSFPALLDYEDLSNTTVPIRFASYNDSDMQIIGSNADIVLITDMSGSMGWRLDVDYVSGNKRACSNPDVYHKNDTERLTLSKCLDIEFTQITMNESLENNSNRQWLVTYSGSAAYFSNDLSELTLSNLEDEIKTYKHPSGGTCIPCALNLAYNILDAYSNENRSKFVVLMTDGIPTYCTSGWSSCNEYGTGTTATYNPWGCIGTTDDCTSGDCDGPISNAINAAKRLNSDMNVSVYTVGIGPVTIDGCDDSHYLLETIANETNGTYQSSKDSSKLKEMYTSIAQDILVRASQVSQFVSIRGDVAPSILYSDSFINITYDPVVDEILPQELSLRYQTPPFGSCNPSVEIFDGMRVIDAKMTSYSDYHWTNGVIVNNITVFNLTEFSTNYVGVGDPYMIGVLPTVLYSGFNDFVISTGDYPGNSSGCSDNNSLVMTVGVNLSTSRSTVLAKKDGCHWEVEFEDLAMTNITIPSSYAGGNNCSYTSSSIFYDPQDAYQVPVYQLYRSLDFDSDGRILVNFESEDLEIIVTVISQVPYLWGPSFAEMVVER